MSSTKVEKGCPDGVVGKDVVVAVRASNEMPKTALVWTLTHVAQPGDRIKLLVVSPVYSSSKRIWGFSRFTSDCTTGHRKSISGSRLDQKDDITDLCAKMMIQLQDVYDSDKIRIRLKIVSGSRCGVVAAEAKKGQSTWVILDRRLEHEKKICMEELQCNIVLMKRDQPKVLRLNLVGSVMEPEMASFDLQATKKPQHCQVNIIRGTFVTPASSPYGESPFTTTDVGTSSISSSDLGTSPFYVSGICESLKKEYQFITAEKQSFDGSDSEADSEMLGHSTRSCCQPWIGNDLGPGIGISTYVDKSQRYGNRIFTSTYDGLLEKLSKLDQEPDIGVLSYRLDVDISRSVREAISLPNKAPPGPPPLCSICQYKAPIFCNPPRWFTYVELDLATDGFSQKNFLAEGGYGSVHRGALQDGRVVAVKQHKLASSQGDVEFCSEVEVLSCAQHRNVVMLIGFCIEDGRRLLVYEYICNGSLDSHLYGRGREPLKWFARQKIAVGAARGLRYLHEECRVGCIVHRDLRPNNILLTHDFEPLVGDFGLARWQPDGDMGVETRVIGTFGYLAPEYAQSGQITEKADVYSFGVVLVELITGRKAMDLKRPKGQQCLSEWARPLLEKHAIHEMIDPELRNCYSEREVHNMLQCASLCIRRDPHLRPRMSQVLRILEGDIVV